MSKIVHASVNGTWEAAKKILSLVDSPLGGGLGKELPTEEKELLFKTIYPFIDIIVYCVLVVGRKTHSL